MLGWCSLVLKMVSAVELSLFGPLQFNGCFSSCIFVLIYYSLITSMKGYFFAMEEPFGCQKRFDCISKLFVSHYPIWSNSGKVVLFRLFVKILTDILFFLNAKFSRDGHFVFFFLILNLFIIALLSSFVIKDALLPLTTFFFTGECLSWTILKIYVKTWYWWCFFL